MKLIRDLFMFDGRLGRTAFAVGTILTGSAAGICALQLLLHVFVKIPFDATSVIQGIGLVLGLWAMVALAWKRLHDIGRSGVFGTLMVVPFVSYALFAILMFLPGEQGANRFGPAPQKPATPVVA